MWNGSGASENYGCNVNLRKKKNFEIILKDNGLIKKEIEER